MIAADFATSIKTSEEPQKRVNSKYSIVRPYDTLYLSSRNPRRL